MVAKTKVFMKYWHPDLLDAMLHSYKVAAVRVQCWVRRFLARKRFVPMLRAYRDQLAMAVTFLEDLQRHGDDTRRALQVRTLCVSV